MGYTKERGVFRQYEVCTPFFLCVILHHENMSTTVKMIKFTVLLRFHYYRYTSRIVKSVININSRAILQYKALSSTPDCNTMDDYTVCVWGGVHLYDGLDEMKQA